MASIFADHMIRRDVVELWQDRGHDAVSSRDLGLDSFADDVQLLAAARSRRILVTHDIKDFEKLHDAWRRWSAAWGVAVTHAGILIVPQGWPPQQTADVVDEFIQTGVDLTSQLYRLSADRTWRLRPLRAAPLPNP